MGVSVLYCPMKGDRVGEENLCDGEACPWWITALGPTTHGRCAIAEVALHIADLRKFYEEEGWKVQSEAPPAQATDGQYQALLDLWRSKAAEEGYLEHYDYHLGMVCPPLPYRRWRIKFDMLQSIQKDPDYFRGDYQKVKKADQLCHELGY